MMSGFVLFLQNFLFVAFKTVWHKDLSPQSWCHGCFCHLFEQTVDVLLSAVACAYVRDGLKLKEKVSLLHKLLKLYEFNQNEWKTSTCRAKCKESANSSNFPEIHAEAALCGIFPTIRWINLTRGAHRPMLSFIGMSTFAEQMQTYKKFCLTLQYFFIWSFHAFFVYVDETLFLNHRRANRAECLKSA